MSPRILQPCKPSTISAARVFEVMDQANNEPKQMGHLKEIERGDIRFEQSILFL